MAGNPDEYRFKPGEIMKYYQWSEEEILATKAFFKEQDPLLWEDLKAIDEEYFEGDLFGGTDPYIRSRTLLKTLYPDWDIRQTLNLWSKLRQLWRSELGF